MASLHVSMAGFLLVAALIITSNGLQTENKQPQRKQEVVNTETEINVYAHSENILKTSFQHLAHVDAYNTDPLTIATAIEHVLHEIVKMDFANKNPVEIDCLYTTQVIAGIKYLFKDHAFPRVKEELVKILDVTFEDPSFNMDLRLLIAGNQNVTTFIHRFYGPALMVIDEMINKLKKKESALELYNTIQGMIYSTYHKDLTAHQFVIEVVVALHNWILTHRSDSDAVIGCETMASTLRTRLQEVWPKLKENFKEEQLKMIAEASFGSSFSGQLCATFVNLTMKSSSILKQPLHSLEIIQQYLNETLNSSTPENHARTINRMVLLKILDVLLAESKTNYVVEKVLYRLSTHAPITLDMPVTEVTLSHLEPLVIELFREIYLLMSTCIDPKLVSTLPGLVEIHVLGIAYGNAHVASIADQCWQIIHEAHPEISIDQKTNIKLKFEKYLFTFVYRRTEEFVKEIDALLHGKLPSETVLLDVMFLVWEVKPTTVREMLSLVTKHVLHTFTTRHECVSMDGIKVHEGAIVIMERFLESLEMTKEYIDEHFYTSVINFTSSTNPMFKSKIEDLLLKETAAALAHCIEDVHLLLVDLKSVSTLDGYRNVFRTFIPDLVAMSLFKNIQIMSFKSPPASYTGEESNVKVNPFLVESLIWQQNVVHDFTMKYMEHTNHIMAMESFTSRMCTHAPEFCKQP